MLVDTSLDDFPSVAKEQIITTFKIAKGFVTAVTLTSSLSYSLNDTV